MTPPRPPPLLLICTILIFFPLLISPTPVITLPLHHHPLPKTTTISSHHPLYQIATASLLRASNLKNPKPIRTSLYPHSYGGYAFQLSYGSPPQLLSVLLDTGSHLSWLPCTHSYQCQNCSALSSAPIPSFLPKASSTSRLVGCSNPSCKWIHPLSILSRCSKNCTRSSKKCTNVCPPYVIIYGSSSTAGLLLEDTLRVSSLVAKNFVAGCSVISVHQPPSGLAGFGRGAPSLPSQLKLGRFSYCLLSRRYDDDSSISGSVILGGGESDRTANEGLQFAPFAKNPTTTDPYSVYYYLDFDRITISGKPVRLPPRAFAPSAAGNGGTIIDSGTTFTYAEPEVFKPIASALAAAVTGPYNRSAAIEQKTGLQPCFTLPPSVKQLDLPAMAFHFKGGAVMELPVENYFVAVGPAASSGEAVCLAVITDIDVGTGENGEAAGGGRGPAIILGSFQQQNFLMVYDLEKERLGFRRQSCGISS